MIKNYVTEKIMLSNALKYVSVCHLSARVETCRNCAPLHISPLNTEFSSFFQVAAATKRGAIGAILYVDPATVAREGTDSRDTYPNAPWVSKDAVFSKRLNQGVGDPLTPHLPSIEGMYRRPRNESNLPSIPAQPISYGDALNLLSRLRGEFCTT